MAFDANREIKIEASEGAPGSFVLRTRGLAARRRAELEMAGVPECGLNAAAGLLNLLADYTVNQAEVLAGQSVGNVLSVGDEGRKLLVAVRAMASEAPKGGLWSKLLGGGKGALRLVDVEAGQSATGAPRTALATMLVHRAAIRAAKKDDDGARTELEAALAVLPGEASAGPAPTVGGAGAEGELNWQNHLAYLDLASLVGRAGETQEAAAFYGAALARSPALTRRELGTTFDALTALTPESFGAEAARIVTHNLGSSRQEAEAGTGLVTLASPIWEPTEDGSGSARRASLVPAEMVSLYYQGPAAEGLRRAGASLVTRILGAAKEPWRAAWLARETRGVWVSEDAPLLDEVGPSHAAHGLASSLLADIARGFRAGATEDEILAHYRGDASEAFEDKLARLAMWESELYLREARG